MYNFNSIKFLINSFIELVNTLGKNIDTVIKFKRQLNKLVDNKDIKIKEALFIFELLDIKNTNNIKWEITTKKVNEFIKACNFIGDLSNREKVNEAVNILESTGEITRQVKNLVVLMTK